MFSYFLCADCALTVGDVLDRPGVVHPLGANLEMKLAQRKPTTALSREKSWYLRTEFSDNAEYIYAVEPIGGVERHHVAWLSKLRDANPQSEGEIDHYSRGYWSGATYPDGRDEPWELRCLKVKVLKRVGGWGLTRQGHAWTA